MPHALKEMPRVAFTRAEMPADQQTQFYKQATDSINAVGQNVKGIDTMLSNWRGWLNGMYVEQERLNSQQEETVRRLEALEATFVDTKDKYHEEAKQVKRTMLEDHEELGRVKGITESHIADIESLLTRCDGRMKEMDEMYAQQLQSLNVVMDHELTVVKGKIQDKVSEISDELVRGAGFDAAIASQIAFVETQGKIAVQDLQATISAYRPEEAFQSVAGKLESVQAEIQLLRDQSGAKFVEYNGKFGNVDGHLAKIQASLQQATSHGCHCHHVDEILTWTTVTDLRVQEAEVALQRLQGQQLHGQHRAPMMPNMVAHHGQPAHAQSSQTMHGLPLPPGAIGVQCGHGMTVPSGMMSPPMQAAAPLIPAMTSMAPMAGSFIPPPPGMPVATLSRNVDQFLEVVDVQEGMTELYMLVMVAMTEQYMQVMAQLERPRQVEDLKCTTRGSAAPMTPVALASSRPSSRRRLPTNRSTNTMASPEELCGARRWPIIWWADVPILNRSSSGPRSTARFPSPGSPSLT